MKTTRTILMAALVALTAGCASKTFYHPVKPASAFSADKRECTLEAEERAENWGGAGNPFMIRDFLVECLEAKGWTEDSAQAAGALL